MIFCLLVNDRFTPGCSDSMVDSNNVIVSQGLSIELRILVGATTDSYLFVGLFVFNC